MNNNKIETLRIVSEEDLRNLTRPGGNGKEEDRARGKIWEVIVGLLDLAWLPKISAYFTCFSNI